MTDAIDFYLNVFEEISIIYNDEASEVCISERLADLIKKLKEENAIKNVKKALIAILSIFEKYYFDDYNNTFGINLDQISNQEKEHLNMALEQEFYTTDLINSKIFNLNKVSKNDKDIIISILKDEILN